MNKRLAILLVLAAAVSAWAVAPEDLIWQDGQWILQPPPDPATPEGQIAMIRFEDDQHHYDKAVEAAKAFLKTHPGDVLREQAYDLAGHAEMHRGLYWQAYEYYDKQLKEFPSGPMVNRAVDREAEIAKAFLAGKKRRVLGFIWMDAQSDGIDILQKIPTYVPGTMRAENALLTVADWYYEMNKAYEAADAYDAYLKLFPYAPRAAFAEFRAAESLRKAYRGPAFEDTTLINAYQRFKAFAEHRPAAAAETHVEQILKAIRADLAQKQFWIAQLYVRMGYEDSAAYYYRFVIAEYADTNWAGSARAEVSKLKNAVVQRPRKPRPPASTQPVEAEAAATTKPMIVFPPEPLPISPLPASRPAPASEPAVETLPSGPEPTSEPAAEPTAQPSGEVSQPPPAIEDRAGETPATQAVLPPSSGVNDEAPQPPAMENHQGETPATAPAGSGGEHE